jgi:hypothetical protein
MDEFLDGYEELCRDCYVPEDRMIDSIVRYAPNADTRAMWKIIAKKPEDRASWSNYRRLLIENTTGAGEDRRHTKAELYYLVSSFRGKPMRTRAQFNEFWHRFLVVSNYLHSHGLLSTEERSRKLLEGLPATLQRRVKAQLQKEYQTHHPEDPFSFDQIFKVNNFVLTAFDDEFDEDLDDYVSRQLVVRREGTSTSTSTAARIYDGASSPLRTSSQRSQTHLAKRLSPSQP